MTSVHNPLIENSERCCSTFLLIPTSNSIRGSIMLSAPFVIKTNFSFAFFRITDYHFQVELNGNCFMKLNFSSLSNAWIVYESAFTSLRIIPSAEADFIRAISSGLSEEYLKDPSSYFSITALWHKERNLKN